MRNMATLTAVASVLAIGIATANAAPLLPNEGAGNSDGLLQQIEPACFHFQKAIRATEPDFRPYSRLMAARNPDIHNFVTPSFLSNEGAPYFPEDDSRAIYLDDVMKRARE